ncbi:hypothetical protein Pcinc_035326 [Petrolisthes cinctipes]|uniref:Small ribosomal subunit protein uS12m n=1 Tax=Petrolisthes cinctipes TaxID=88211 RepID=A0AAE1BY68_PETCI|nr:hypothetical protein Pcinc_035326 [Petrolisthes cinctipes]
MAFKNLVSAFSRLNLIPFISRGESAITRATQGTTTTVQQAVCTTINTNTYLRRYSTKQQQQLHDRRTSLCIPASSPLLIPSFTPLSLASQVRQLATCEVRCGNLYQMHSSGPHIKKRKNKNPLVDRPYARGVVLKTLVKKPKKPNSANRKCVLVRLTTGREMVAYVPGEGHNLQEHNIVLVRPGRLRDVPGVKLKCIRGKYDLQHVIKKQSNQ